MPSENNKRIAKNTLFLYFRMMLTMGVSLYTSRIVLATLGIEDYGIYSIVGGIIVMFGFLNSSMSGATSRFLTYELGQDNYEKLKKTFSAALTVHFIIAGIIFILGETIGLWWLENKLVVPLERMTSARWVYQLSIISAMISITQVPYNATIIAHERMNIYAYVEILNSLLKLGIVYLLVIGNFDKLILYAILTLCVTIIITTIYKIYCLRNFSESDYKFEWNQEIMKPMISFSGWNIYYTMGYSLRTQGVNMLLNMFFGVAINAAYGLATQLNHMVSAFSSNFLTAVNPQIVKYYAMKEIEKMQSLIYNSTKFSFLLIAVFSFPIIIENKFLLAVWLKNVPDYAVIFCQLYLIFEVMLSMNNVLRFAIFATGKIKNWALWSGTLYLLVLPFSYIFLKFGFSPIVPFVVHIFMCIFYLLGSMITLHSLVKEFSIINYTKRVLGICVIAAFVSLIIPMFLHFKMAEGWIRLILVCLTSVISICFAGYFIVFDKFTRYRVVMIIKRKIKDVIILKN